MGQIADATLGVGRHLGNRILPVLDDTSLAKLATGAIPLPPSRWPGLQPSAGPYCGAILLFWILDLLTHGLDE